MEWILATDPQCVPHTPRGAHECLGGITIGDNDQITRNVGYYLIAHASKFVPKNSVRIDTNAEENLPNVAFQTPQGDIALIAHNKGATTQKFNILHNGQQAKTELESGALATYVWSPAVP
jgi:glucosylceramidase